MSRSYNCGKFSAARGPFKYYVIHRGGEVVRQMLTLAYGEEGGISQNITCLQRGGVRQILTHLKCCTSVDTSARDNACTQKIVKNWLKPLFN